MIRDNYWQCACTIKLQKYDLKKNKKNWIDGVWARATSRAQATVVEKMEQSMDNVKNMR